MKGLYKWLFPPTIKEQMMLGVLLVVMFLLPVKVGFILWPGPTDSDLWKVAAIMVSGALFVALKTSYMYFSLRLTECEIKSR
jgi:hypothetical protein